MDPWLIKITDRLRAARTRNEIESVMDDLEDRFDAFSGPGEELVAQLMEEARRRLRELEAGA
ncbi:MAG: hypothetical protein MUC79_03350 [Thiobacillaceae bacterium]|jgi:hypothetical protein|nr:hypothetical protein [Thiobacillaceae bacterium]